jgi:hypothetical protein
MKKLRIYEPQMEHLPPFFLVNMDECSKRLQKNGYVLLYLPTHPFSDYNGYVLAHRVIAEQYLGRYLTASEVIHHIDNDKTNNDLDNLWLFPDQQTHLRVGHCPTQNKALVEEVLLAAKDRSINFSDLSCSKHTARRILSILNVDWLAGDEIGYSEDDVKNAIYQSDGSLASAAKKLKTSAETLRRKFPHLVPTSNSRKFGYLDDMKSDILDDYHSGMTIGKLAEKYQTQRKTLELAFHRWGIPSGKNRNINKKKLTAVIDSLVADYQSGMKICAIAEKHKSNVTTVRTYLAEAGVFVENRRPQGFLDSHKDEILKMRESGMTFANIASHFQTDRSTLKRFFERLKLNGQQTELVSQ